MKNEIKVETAVDKEATVVLITKPDGSEISIMVYAQNNTIGIHARKCNWELTNYTRTHVRLEIMK